MKNVQDQELPTSNRAKKKVTLRILFPIIIIMITLSILFILHTSGSYASNTGEIDTSFVTDNTQTVEPGLQETKAAESSPEETQDPVLSAEPIPTVSQNPGEESEPDPTEDSTSKPVTTPETELVAPTEHTHLYKDSIVAPTCCSKGYTLHECACGQKYTDNEQDQLSHTYTEQIVPPTVDSQGYTLHICSECNYQFKDNYTDPIVPPTEPSVEVTQPPATEPEVESEHPEEDYGFCPACGRRLWTSWYPSGCFTYLQDTVCSCGQLVHAMQCHHH